MSPKTPDNPDFTHLGWQQGAGSHTTEEDHLILHVDQPAPSGVPEFHEVEDAVMPSPTYLWPAHEEQGRTEEPSMIVFGEQDADQSESDSVFS